MTRANAIELYIRKHATAKEIIRRLMLWNTNLSIPENAKKMRVSNDNIRGMAKRCGLKYKKVKAR